MKKILLASFILFASSSSQGQNRKHSSNFSTFQQYYNPAFTGFQGSVVKSYYRNQWAGFDGAPTTLFVSGEINLSDYGNKSLLVEGLQPVKRGVKHSMGFSVLHDSYGPFVENQILLSYKSLVSLTDKIRLQAGGAIAYHAQSLDGSKLTSEEVNDPTLQQYANQTSRSNRMDFNMGLALSGPDFYAGYAMQNIRGSMGSPDNDFFTNNGKMQHNVQAGYRAAISDQVGLVFNGLFRFDNQLKQTIEGQLKGVFYNTAWVGFGYRRALAYSLTAGFRMKQLKFGYSYEIPTGDAQMTGSETNEIVVTYDLKKIIHPKQMRQMSIW
nr:Bacteroidetes-specific putative membrane protein [uncultured bacterium]